MPASDGIIPSMETIHRRSKKPPTKQVAELKKGGAKHVEKWKREIRRPEEFRYALRLHGVWMLARGMTYPAVAKVLGESQHTIYNWVRRYLQAGVAGLHEEKRNGRPPRLTEEQRPEIAAMVRESRQGSDAGPWTGKALAVWIAGR
jgi:transposase-like protein